MIIRDGLSFDDVLLSPQYSMVKSRSSVNLSVKSNKLGIDFKHPIIPANMKTIMEYEMAKAVYLSGGLGIVHRFMELSKQLEILFKLEMEFGRMVWSHIGFSVGVKKEDYNDIETLVKSGAKILCIDIAHGDSASCIDMCHHINLKYPEIFLIAGNVSTGKGAERLWQAGADMVKVGVGPGSLCTTRIETGNGVPQLTALMDVSESQKKFEELYCKKFPFIADGGIKNAGDIVKALCFADMVMIGNLFAGCVETPGTILNIDGRSYKEYVGSSTHKTTHIEGVASIMPTKGTYASILDKLMQGLRSGCSYQGVDNLTDLKDNPVFIKMTSAGLRESHPHDVTLK